jgi:hypothetical protein
MLELIHTQEEYAKLKQSTAGASKTNGTNPEVETLKKQLAEAQREARDFG